MFFYNFAQGIGGHMEPLGNFRQLRHAVMIFNIFQYGKDEILLILGRILSVDLIRVI